MKEKEKESERGRKRKTKRKMVGCCLVLPLEMGLGRKFLAASASCIVDAPAQEGCRGPMGEK